jgi:predicted component of type VI protein secretion system
LLDELSPEAIEKSLDQEGGMPAFGKHRALWQAYQEKFDQLSEEKEAFSRIFGPEFTQSYREYQRRRSGSPGNR